MHGSLGFNCENVRSGAQRNELMNVNELEYQRFGSPKTPQNF